MPHTTSKNTLWASNTMASRTLRNMHTQEASRRGSAGLSLRESRRIPPKRKRAIPDGDSPSDSCVLVSRLLSAPPAKRGVSCQAGETAAQE